MTGYALSCAIAREQFAAARLTAARRMPYLASALYAMCPVEASIGTFAVDARWRIYVDPTTLERWGVQAAAAVLLHEVNHLLRDHAARYVGPGDDFDRRVWNLACDAAINDDLERCGVALPDPVLPATFSLPDGGLEEDYLDALRDRFGDGRLPGIECESCGSGAGAVPDVWEVNGDQAPGLSSSEALLVRVRTARAVSAAASSGSAGSAPAGLRRWAAKALAPQVRWKQELAALLRSGRRSVVGLSASTWARPDRRADSRPGFLYPGRERRIVDIVAVIDTSASMNADRLGSVVAEVEELARVAGVRLRYLSCDVDASLPALHRQRRELELVGGGGTDLRVGVDAAFALRPRPELVVVLTDGRTPWPTAARRGTQLLAVVLGNDDVTIPASLGIRVIRIPAHR